MRRLNGKTNGHTAALVPQALELSNWANLRDGETGRFRKILSELLDSLLNDLRKSRTIGERRRIRAEMVALLVLGDSTVANQMRDEESGGGIWQVREIQAAWWRRTQGAMAKERHDAAEAQ